MQRILQNQPANKCVRVLPELEDHRTIQLPDSMHLKQAGNSLRLV